MQTTSTPLKTAFSLLFALLFILSLPAALAAYDAGSLLFDEARMTTLLEDAVVHSKLVPLGLSWYAHTLASRYPPDPYSTPDYLGIMSHLTTQDWITLRQVSVTDEMLLGWTDATTGGAYAWLDNEEARPEVQWALQPLRQHLQHGNGEKALQIVYTSLPPCTQEQINDFKQRQNAVPAGIEVPYNPCHFPGPWESDQYDDYLTSVEEMVAALPAGLDLVRTLAPDTPDGDFLTLKSNLRSARALSQWGWLFPLLLLLLTAALSIRSRRTLGLWWGLPLFLGGLLTLGLYFLIPPAALSQAHPFLTAWPEELTAESEAFLARLLGIIVRPLLWQGLLVTAAGLLGAVGAALPAGRKEEAVSAE